jgi:Protein of unknown function (DUF2726)
MGLLDNLLGKTTESATLEPAGTKPPSMWTIKPARILARDERAIFQLLRRAWPEFVVLPKVQAYRFITFDNTVSSKDFMRQLGAATIDFAVCNEATEMLLAVDLGASDSENPERRTNVADALRRFRIKQLTIQKSAPPDVESLRRVLVSIEDDKQRLLKEMGDEPGGNSTNWAFQTGAARLGDAGLAPPHMRSGGWRSTGAAGLGVDISLDAAPTGSSSFEDAAFRR